MKKIFLDLEMNGVPWKIRKRCGLRMEIIEIGAVMLNDENEETGCFREFVKPQLSDAMEPAVEKLTNIHFDQLESAPPLEDVLRRFLIWCGDGCEVYSWSDADSRQIIKETDCKGIGQSAALQEMLGCWHDYQAEFGALLPFEKKLSLSQAVLIAGLEFSGRAHDGLNDARSTADLYRMAGDPQQFGRFRKNVRRAFGLEEESPVTMGDLFDFSNLTSRAG